MTTLVTTRPPAAPTPDWSFPTVVRHRLEGVELIASHLAARPLVHVTVVLDTGVGADPTALPGVASLLGASVLRGAAGLDQHGLAVAFERVGAVPSVQVDHERTDLSLEVPEGLLPEAMALLAEVLRRPTLDPDEVVRVRDARIDSFLARETNADFRVARAASAGMWAPSSRLHLQGAGSVEHLRTIAPDHVAAHHAERWAGAPVTLVLAGDLSQTDLAQVAAPLVGATAPLVTGPTDMTLHADGSRIVLTDVPGAVQSTLRVLGPGPAFGEGDAAAREVATTALFGSFGSRLNLRLREELGYTYGASGSFSSLRDGGWWQAGCSVRTEVTGDAVTELLGVLRTAVGDGLADAEVAHARDNLVQKFAVRYDGTGPVAAALARRAHRGLDDDERDQRLAELREVTTESATAALRSSLGLEHVVVAIAGAAGEVREALADAGGGPVVDVP